MEVELFLVLLKPSLRNMTGEERKVRWIPSRSHDSSSSLNVLWCWLAVLWHGSRPDIHGNEALLKPSAGDRFLGLC